MKLIHTKSFVLAVNEYGDPNANNVCILMPGRLDTKDYANFVSHGQLLGNLGFYTIAVDPPFTWDSPGDLSGYTTSAYVRAINELIETLGDHKTILIGHSRGGATAMLAAANPFVQAVVLINAAYGSPTPPDISRLIDGKLPESRDLPPGDERTNEQKQFMLPLSYFEDGNMHDPVEALRRFSGPKLLIHATRDEFCDLESVKGIYDELPEEKEFLVIDSVHDYRLSKEAIDQVNRSLERFVTRVG